MKQISFFIPLLGTLLLSGCAGTSTEFECNATTSDDRLTGVWSQRRNHTAVSQNH